MIGDHRQWTNNFHERRKKFIYLFSYIGDLNSCTLTPHIPKFMFGDFMDSLGWECPTILRHRSMTQAYFFVDFLPGTLCIEDFDVVS